jgi:hypothetical protein
METELNCYPAYLHLQDFRAKTPSPQREKVLLIFPNLAPFASLRELSYFNYLGLPALDA